MNEAYQFPSFQTEVTPLFSHKKLQIAGVGAHIGIVISSVIDPIDLAASFNSTVSTSATDVDVQAYTANSNLPVPTVTIRPVDGGSGPFVPGTADSDEASLDTQMSLGTAPGATETLYNLPELTTDEIIAGYTAVDEDNIVDVVSSSFGECELDFTAAYNNGTDFTSILKTIHSLFQQGNAQGITFLASSGDNGAPSCVSQAFADSPVLIDGTNFVLGVQNPADDPNVTSVGGTNLQTVASPGVNDSTYLSENADFDPRLPIQFLLPDGTVGSHRQQYLGFGRRLQQDLRQTRVSIPRQYRKQRAPCRARRFSDDGRLSRRCGSGRAGLHGVAAQCGHRLDWPPAESSDRHQFWVAGNGGCLGAGG